MIQTKIISNKDTADLLKKMTHTASYYGFENIEKAIDQQKKHENYLRENTDEKILPNTQKKQSIKQNKKNYRADIIGNEIENALKIIASNGVLPNKNPILIHQNNITENTSKKSKNLRFGLVAIGMKKSIAEALIIKTANSILNDMGVGDTQVYINSIGDRESVSRFTSELNSYLKKNINTISAQARHAIEKENILSAYCQLYPKQYQLEDELPQSIKFLSDKNRQHLSEILEYLETGDISYEIDNFLVGSDECYSQTLFEIRHIQNSELDNEISILAKGGRCDEISRRMFNVEIPTVGIVFEFEKENVTKKKIPVIKKTRKPKTYFIQLGYEAKKRSLLIIEILRKANISTYHSLDNDKLTDQLAYAKYLGVKNTIIMGQREVLDGTVIVRNMDTQFQNTILVEDLPNYLKEMYR